MTLGTLPLYVLADGTDAELPEQITETTNENLTAFQLGLGEKSVAELENMTLSAADIPASISRETVEAKDHVLRLREQEADLNTVIFQNRDGSKTVYLFGSPVKIPGILWHRITYIQKCLTEKMLWIVFMLT